MNPIRVLIVDEHKQSRLLASRVIESAPNIVSVGEATSPFTVRKAVQDYKPDVLALNAQSRLSSRFNRISNSIAVPVVKTPLPESNDDWHSIGLHKVQYEKYASELINRIKSAARVDSSSIPAQTIVPKQENPKQEGSLGKNNQGKSLSAKPLQNIATHPLIVIGSAGGDIDAVKSVLLGLQLQSVGILIAQQIPASFDHQYRHALEEILSVPVLQATHGQPIEPGTIMLTPSDRHIKIAKRHRGYYCQFSNRRIDSKRKPSLDLLFSSLAENAGNMGIGILLLGAGVEGSMGLSRLRQVGANVLVQENDLASEEKMPSAAIMNGGAELVVPLNSIATKVSQIITGC